MQVDKLYFFTTSILQWTNVLDTEERKAIIIESLRYIAVKKRAKVCAFVIMPNHIHIIWQPLDNKVQLSFMKFTAQQLLFDLQKNSSVVLSKLLVQKKDRQFQVWQRNPLAIELYSRNVVEQKLDYIHNNLCQPKWMLAENPMKYKYSSIRFYENNESNFDFLTHYMEMLG